MSGWLANWVRTSSGLGGAAATGDGDLMTQVGISALSSAFFLCMNIDTDSPLRSQYNFLCMNIDTDSPLRSQYNFLCMNIDTDSPLRSQYNFLCMNIDTDSPLRSQYNFLSYIST